MAGGASSSATVAAQRPPIAPPPPPQSATADLPATTHQKSTCPPMTSTRGAACRSAPAAVVRAPRLLRAAARARCALWALSAAAGAAAGAAAVRALAAATQSHVAVLAVLAPPWLQVASRVFGRAWSVGSGASAAPTLPQQRHPLPRRRVQRNPPWGLSASWRLSASLRLSPLPGRSLTRLVWVVGQSTREQSSARAWRGMFALPRFAPPFPPPPHRPCRAPAAAAARQRHLAPG